MKLILRDLFLSLKLLFNVKAVCLMCYALMISQISFGQARYEELKAALIFGLVDHIYWPDENSKTELAFAVYSSTPSTTNLLQQIAQAKRIRGKKCVIRQISSLNDLGSVDVLVIDSGYSGQLGEIYQATHGKEILMISEEANDGVHMMLNLTYDDSGKKLSFEINRPNILIEGLQAHADLLLLGGSEIDVREVYYDMVSQLEEEKKESLKQQQTIARQLEKISTQNNQISKQNNQISKQNNRIMSQERRIAKLSNDTLLLYQKISAREGDLRRVLDQIALREASYTELETKIAEQDAQLNTRLELLGERNALIARRTKELDSLTRLGKAQQNIIDDQTSSLDDSEQLISLQRSIIYLSVFFLLVLGIMSILFYRLFSKHRDVSNELASSNEKLKVAIDEQNETNHQLLIQKNDLNSALEKLEKTQGQLVKSEKMAALGVLTAGVAHEINNPINFVKSGLIVLKKNMPGQLDMDERLSKVFTNMETGVKRIVAIVHSLGSFSRTSAEESVSADLHETLDNCIVMLANEYKTHISIKKNYYQEPIQVQFNSGKLYQVFTNLLINSIHAIKVNGEIEIFSNFDKNADVVKVSIKDNGHGIPSDIMEKIFDPFFTTKEIGRGTGLGLSIITNLLSEFDGKINIQSVENQGTTAFVELKPYKNG